MSKNKIIEENELNNINDKEKVEDMEDVNEMRVRQISISTNKENNNNNNNIQDNVNINKDDELNRNLSLKRETKINNLDNPINDYTEKNNLITAPHHNLIREREDRTQFSHTEVNITTNTSLLTNNDNYSKTYKSKNESFQLSLDLIITSSLKLIKTNEEFLYLTIFLVIWLSLILFEFLYGFMNSQVQIISDSFFNYFKTFSFLITGFSILATRVFSFNKVFLKNRIELISALSNCVFLIIVSLYMCLQALHLITEPEDHKHDYTQHDKINKEEAETIYFYKNFYIVKVLIDVIAILVFSDYIVHPSIQLKLLMWKRNRSWKSLSELDLDNLKECKTLIRIWNNHFENMNALTINILSDLISSILFLICFYLSKDQHFEGVYTFISIVNLIILGIFITPVMKSIIKILMQGRSELYESFYNCLEKEVNYFEGCMGIREMKFWMTAQNEIKCKI